MLLWLSLGTFERQVGPVTAVLRTFERQVGLGTTVLRTFERQVGPGPVVLGTFERQVGPGPAVLGPLDGLGLPQVAASCKIFWSLAALDRKHLNRYICIYIDLCI